MNPLGRFTQNRFRGATRFVILERGSKQGQLGFSDRMVAALFPNNWKWLSPITLTREESVAEFVLDTPMTIIVRYKPINHRGLGLCGGKTVKKT